MQPCRWPCSVLAEFMVKWNWENGLQKNFSNWTLLWQWATWCYITHLCCCWQVGSQWEYSKAEKGKVFQKTARLHLDWSEQWGAAHICNKWLRPSLDHWIPCRIKETIWPEASCGVCARYKICAPSCRRRRWGVPVVSPQWEIHHCKFGLLSTPLGAPLCTCKNLWVCGNCHSFTKFIAKITGRAITARDAIWFYHIEDDHLLLLGLLVMPGVSSQQMDWVLFSCNRPSLHYCKRCLKSSGCACYYDPTLSFGHK